MKAIINIRPEVSPVCSWPPTVLSVFFSLWVNTTGIHSTLHCISVWHLLQVSVYISAPPAVWNDPYDVHFSHHPRCVWFLRSAVWWRSPLFLHSQTVCVSSLCAWWGCQRDSVWPSDETRQGRWLDSVSLTCSRWQSQKELECVCVSESWSVKACDAKPQVFIFIITLKNVMWRMITKLHCQSYTKWNHWVFCLN